MKITAAPGASSAFDLLDREEVWEWGTCRPCPGFEARATFYLEAVTVLGRPIGYRDADGGWGAAYTFNKEFRRKYNQGLLSPHQRRVVSSLPYFFHDHLYQAMSKRAHAILDFCTKNGRLPSQSRPQESPLVRQWYTLYKNIKNNTLPEDLMTLLAPCLETPGLYDIRWNQKVDAVKEFVTRFKYVPGLGAKGTDEYRLGAFLAKAREHKRSGRLSDSRIRDLETIPGFTWTPASGRRFK
jgi:hypothetical protein